MSISKTDLRKAIYQQTINSEKISYSYVNKSQQTLSMMKNERLLIFNHAKGHLYYINEPKALPFGKEMPLPKNNLVADMNLSSIVKNVNCDVIVQFTVAKDKNQMMEWNFVCENNALATAWVKVVSEYKDQKKNPIKKPQQVNKSPSPAKNTTESNVKENPFNTSNLGYSKANQPTVQPKPIQPKTQPIGYQNNTTSPVIKPTTAEQLGYSNVSNVSNQLSRPGESTLINKPAETINNKPTNLTNIQPSNNVPPASTNQQRQPVINIQPVPNNETKQPNITISPIPSMGSSLQRQPSRLQVGQSRATFRDQIQSILAMSKASQYNSQQSNISNNKEKQPKYNRTKDWNWRFYNNPSEQVMYQFEQYSIQSFKSILPEDRLSTESLRVYLKEESLIIVTNYGSVEAKKIKAEFRNYHFMMEAIKTLPYGDLVGVPLSCLIEYQGVITMVKSLIPDSAPKVEFTQELSLQLKKLQRYTRIKNGILKKSTLYDLSQIYDTRGKRLIFINQLIQYLPVHTEEEYFGSLLRPEHILDNVNQFMHGGMGYEATRLDNKVFNDVIQMVKNNCVQLAKELSFGDVKVANGEEIKNIMHQRGINLKYLPLLYTEITNKHVKKHVHSFMLAKIAKEDIFSNIVSSRPDRAKSTKKQPQLYIMQLIEKSLRLLVEGNSNISNELWKELSMNFKKQYNMPMSQSDIHGPFFLNSLMGLLRGKFDMKRCNMKKVLFKDQNIIANGFVVEIGMKVKSYYRWMTEGMEKVVAVCKGEEKNEEEFIGVCEMLELKAKGMPKYLQMIKVAPLLQEYLTSFIPPPEFQRSSFGQLTLYGSISLEPPTTHSLNVTLNYLKWCLEFDRGEDFKMAIDQALFLIDLWLGAGNGQKGNIYHCQFYQLLAEYYSQQGAIDDSINFLKEALATMIRNNGLGSKKISDRYFLLASKEMKAGRWRDSLDNFLKAKNSMQSTQSTQRIIYPLTLTKLSQLYLNFSEFQTSLLYAKQSVEQFEKLQSSLSKSNPNFQKQLYDEYCIKSIEIMMRIFQIEGKKNQLFRLGQMAIAKYNKTKSEVVYEKLVRICLITLVTKHSVEKCKMFHGLVDKVMESQYQNEPQSRDEATAKSSLTELMTAALQVNILEKFMVKFESLQRMVTDINGRRVMGGDTKQFISIVRAVVNIVGEEFVSGLVQQKQLQEQA